MINETDEQFYFFWSGPLSQWHSSRFKIDGIVFNTAEQYMMYSKAILFNDHDAAKKILRTTSPREQKSLGRKVKNFNVQKWEAVARDIVYRGNYAKFTQDPTLLQLLINTAPSILVEASPYDKIWGIGLDEYQAVNMEPSQWPGKNWLGLTLTKLRDDLITQKQNQ